MNESTSNPFEFTRDMWEVAVETTIAIIIAVSSIAGNLLVFIAFYRDRSLRTVPNAFIISLATTDFLFATTRLPMFIHTVMVGRWEFSQAVCIFQGFQGFNLFSVTLLTLSAISISRCCLVVFPLRYKAVFSKKTVPRIIVGIWLFSTVLCSAPLFGWGLYQFDPLVFVCTFDHTSSKSYHVLTNTLMQINLVIIVICYFLILKKVRDHQKRISTRRVLAPENGVDEGREDEGPSPPQNINQDILRREEIHITRTLLIVVSLFGLCWFPSAILSNLESEEVRLPRGVRLFETMSIGMNSMINPLVYGIRIPKFRRAFISALRCQ